MEVPIELIEPNPMRVALEPEVNDLVDSLSRNGQLSSIRVRPHPTKKGHYQIIFGNRRLAAARKLGWRTIAAELSDANDSEVLVIAYSENGARADFTDYERALLLQRMHELTNKSYAEIAKTVGKSPAYVSQHIAMLQLFSPTIASNDEVTKVLNSLSEKHARILARRRDMQDRWNTAKLVVTANLSPRELEKMSARSASLRPKKRKGNKDEIENVVYASVEGLPRKDMRPFFELLSPRGFSMFSRFPPYDRLDVQESSSHIRQTLHKLDSVKAQIVDLDIKVRGKIAFATYFVLHELSVGGKTMNLKTRATVILEHEGKHWTIVHAHYSDAEPTEFAELFAKSEGLQTAKQNIQSKA